MPKPSQKQQLTIRHKADAVESALTARGIYHMPNEPGVSSAVVEELYRRHRDSDLRVERPPHGFGGEYVFTSANQLGTKSNAIGS